MLSRKAENLEGQDLSGQDLSNTDFRRASLKNCNLKNCNLSGCIFIRTNFEGADLQGADISNSNFEKALNLNLANFIGAVWNNRIITTQATATNDKYFVLKTDAFVQIGCNQKTKSDWLAMSDDSIKELGRVRSNITKQESDIEAEEALVWWNNNKAVL